MANNLSQELLAQLFGQESDDPFLTLITLNHPDFGDPIYLVNDTQNLVSRGKTYQAFPMRITLPVDDGETARQVAIEFDNVSLELMNIFRQVTTPIPVTLEMVLASLPDEVQYQISELKIGNIQYNAQVISAKLFMDDFMSVALTSEAYTPSNYPGLF